MSEAIACLVRVGDNIRKNRLIKLDRDQVTVGRSGDVNYTILSTMISRCHAIFKQQESKWTIADNKSLNGVYINGRQLTPFKACTLEDGDMVQLGVPTSPDTPAEFLYKFHASLKVRIKKDTSKKLRECQADSEEPRQQSQDTGSLDESDGEEVRKRKVPEACGSSRVETAASSSKEAEYQARLAEMERLLQEKELKQSEVEKQLEKEKEEREMRMKEVEELRLNEQAILMEMQDKQAELEKEKEELKRQMQAELEANLKEKEQALISQLADQKQSLLEEKKRVEDSLQEEMTKALESKNKEIEMRLISMKENLEKVIEKKDSDQKLLEARLNETREENECAKLQALKAREDVLSNFVDLMEMELQCTICNELFIKATALNCAHVFCKLCINQWMKVKKECPNCRVKITTHMQAIALDSYIEKMVEQFSEDLKANRKTLLEQRKAEQEKFDAPPVLPPTTYAANARGRGRGGRNNRGGRGGRNARGRGAAGAYTPGNGRGILPTPVTATVNVNTGRTVTGVHATTRTTTGVYATGISTRGAAHPLTINSRVVLNPLMTFTAAPVPIIAPTTTITTTARTVTRGLYTPGPSAISANPLIMTVGAPPVPSTATLALRSLLGIQTTTTSASAPSTVTAVLTNASYPVASASTAASTILNLTTTSSATPLLVTSSAATSNATPSVSGLATSTTTPIIISDETSEATPIEVGEENTDVSDADTDEEEYENLMYDRYRRRRRYWLEPDTEDEDGNGTDEDGDEDDRSVEGNPTEYFGGYGRCFKCGRRGHWANGCPS